MHYFLDDRLVLRWLQTIVMPELIGLTQRLEAYKGIDSVQTGRRLQGNALAPTFQVYLSDQLDNGFKLLARSGNLVQEVCIRAWLFPKRLFQEFSLTLVEALVSRISDSVITC